jgi:hypothetical protein
MDKATLLTDVNSITGRSETATTFDPLLLEVLIEVSARTRYLKTTAAGITTEDQNYIDKPSDMAGSVIDGLVINGEKYNPISWDDFLEGEETGYCVMGDKIYLSPTPDSAYSYTLYYARIHPSSMDTILLPDIFKPAVKHLCCSKVYGKYEIRDKQVEEYQYFENEMRKHSGYGQPPPVCKPFMGI